MMPTGTIPLLVKVWGGAGTHRHRYIGRSLPSLLGSDLPAQTRVILVDDQSDDPKVVDLLARLAATDSRVELWRNPERMGPNRGQEYNFPLMVERFPDAPAFGICDDDIVYHPGWLQRLLTVMDEARAVGVSGIFTALNVEFRPSYGHLQLPTSETLLKERQAALNWLLPRDVYERVGPFKDAGIAYDTEYCDRLAQHKLPVVCLKPSYVQNIGYFGAYQSSNVYVAPDFVGRRDLWMWSRDLVMTARRGVGMVRDRLT
jgi:GT2 family glycosyltransferase